MAGDRAELDVAARDFWGDGLWAFFDTRVFDPGCRRMPGGGRRRSMKSKRR